eukprot:31609_1
MAHACRGGPPGVPHGEIGVIPPFENERIWVRAQRIQRNKWVRWGIFLGLYVLVALLVISYAGDNTPALIKPKFPADLPATKPTATYPKSLLAATKDAADGSEFTFSNINELLENFRKSPPLVMHPYEGKSNQNPPA